MKKILLILAFMMPVIVYSQVDTLSAAGATTHKVVRDKLNEAILALTAVESVAYDTISIARSIPFQVGRGIAADSALFATGAIIFVYENNIQDTIVIDSIRARMLKASSDITCQVFSADTLEALAPDSLNTGGFNFTSVGVSEWFTTFTGSGVLPPGKVLYMKVESWAIKPTLLDGVFNYHVQ